MTTTIDVEDAKAAFEGRFAAGELSNKDLERLNAVRIIDYYDTASGDVDARRAAVHKELVRRTRKRAESDAARAAVSEPSDA